ncbi:MAG: N-acetyltransferase [Pontiellaceae bacterium]|nr:N-acetyltransferase [Pontiellaceae bacterium]MBN2784399.1 N-acetyltransferase [Pontiellaceae bacterium]
MPIIRKEYYEDYEAVREVHRKAFGRDIEPNLVISLRNTDRMLLSLIAENSRSIAGHILFTTATVDGSNIRLATLGPLAVRPDQQHHGIGTLLAREGINICRELGIPAVVVLGEPRFYYRCGFKSASNFGLFPSWQGIPDEAFMALELVPDALKSCQGIVRFAPQFDLAMPADQGL